MEIAQLAQVDAVAFGEQCCQFLAQDGQDCLDICFANSGRTMSKVAQSRTYKLLLYMQHRYLFKQPLSQ